jgi:hypothetical protein
MLSAAIAQLDVEQARKDVTPFIKNQQMLALWSHEFFSDVVRRIHFDV